MKKYRIILFCLFAFILTSCEKSNDEINSTIEVCGVKDPVRNIPWLKAEYLEMGSAIGNGIVLYNYQGQDIIEVQYSIFSSTNQHQHLCNGTKLNLDDITTFKKYKEERKEIAILFGTKIWQ
ncbi:MAG: hypothetical protein V4663_17995 [Bacteroidota bacterium]